MLQHKVLIYHHVTWTARVLSEIPHRAKCGTSGIAIYGIIVSYLRLDPLKKGMSHKLERVGITARILIDRSHNISDRGHLTGRLTIVTISIHGIF